MAYLELAILMGCFSALLLNVPMYQRILMYLNLNTKPFNCALCLGFWNALVISSVHYQLEFMEVLFVAATTSIISELMDRKLNDF